MFIAIEGIDGSGKSTQCKLLKEYLEGKGIDCIMTSEPTHNTEIGKLVRKILSGEIKNIDPLVLSYLFVADRIQHIKEEIMPALLAKKVVITDRYYLSTIAYQSVAGVDVQTLYSIHRGLLKPDVTLFIDITPETAMKRLNGRNNTQIYENLNTLTSVREAFIKAMAFELFEENVDGEGTKEEVFNLIKESIDSLIKYDFIKPKQNV